MEQEKYRLILPADYKDILPTILKNKRKQIEELREATNQGDLKKSALIAHKMSGPHGLDGINEIAPNLEMAAKQNDKENVIRMVGRLEEYLNHLDVSFEREA